MEFDKALEFAVILGWHDLERFNNPYSARVVYRRAVGTAVDYVSIWSVDAEGHQKMVCDYWTWTSSAHPCGMRCNDKFQSKPLGLALDFILMNQDQFTHPVDACPEGLALIYPPTRDEFDEAATWMGGFQGAATSVSRADTERAAAR